jgi:hypothetical protein
MLVVSVSPADAIITGVSHFDAEVSDDWVSADGLLDAEFVSIAAVEQRHYMYCIFGYDSSLVVGYS